MKPLRLTYAALYAPICKPTSSSSECLDAILSVSHEQITLSIPKDLLQTLVLLIFQCSQTFMVSRKNKILLTEHPD